MSDYICGRCNCEPCRCPRPERLGDLSAAKKRETVTEPKRDEAQEIADELVRISMVYNGQCPSKAEILALIRPHLAPRPVGMEEVERHAAELEYIATHEIAGPARERPAYALKESATLLRALARENAAQQEKIRDMQLALDVAPEPAQVSTEPFTVRYERWRMHWQRKYPQQAVEDIK